MNPPLESLLLEISTLANSMITTTSAPQRSTPNSGVLSAATGVINTPSLPQDQNKSPPSSSSSHDINEWSSDLAVQNNSHKMDEFINRGLLSNAGGGGILLGSKHSETLWNPNPNPNLMNGSLSSNSGLISYGSVQERINHHSQLVNNSIEASMRGTLASLNESLLNSSLDSSLFNTSMMNDSMSNVTSASNNISMENPGMLNSSEVAAWAVMYALATILSISGNILVVLVFTKGRRCRTDIRPFLINLAVADLIMAVFCMPFTSTYVMMTYWVFTEPLCPIVLFFQNLSVSASVFTNMAIGTDRFLVVMFPLKSRVTTARAKYVLLTIWAASTILGSVQFFVGRTREEPNGTNVITCDERWETREQRTTFTMFVLAITYVVPLTILAIAYTVVGIKLWRRTAPGNTDETRDHHQLRTKKKVSSFYLFFKDFSYS